VHEALVRNRKQGDDKNKEKGHKNFLKLLNVVGMAQGNESRRKKSFTSHRPELGRLLGRKLSLFAL